MFLLYKYIRIIIILIALTNILFNISSERIPSI